MAEIRTRRPLDPVPGSPDPDKNELTAEVAAWEQHRNKHRAKADWQFTAADARVKLARLYHQFK